VSDALWARRPRPAPGPDASTAGRWDLTSPAELTAHRMQLSAALSNHARPAGADDDAVERLLLAFEELASNALRHGRPPVRVAVTTTGTSWLLEVSDAAVDLPPRPAVGRDAAVGGLGPLPGRRHLRHTRLGRRRPAQGGVVPDPLHPRRGATGRPAVDPRTAKRRRQLVNRPGRPPP
jgi:hypothetical protein